MQNAIDRRQLTMDNGQLTMDNYYPHLQNSVILSDPEGSRKIFALSFLPSRYSVRRFLDKLGMTPLWGGF